ncbi:LuxR C-terminal-related transcriptional regulator [Streptomyces sp. NPDC052077]|uniref:LuxR C-terminal-related transcriptional regulator n=1 Tax=Streptomyces sp. NPDC052077 TaxID=3154757 RepID=UPI00341C6EC9
MKMIERNRRNMPQGRGFAAARAATAAGVSAGDLHEDQDVYIPGRFVEKGHLTPPEVSGSLRSIKLANSGIRRALVHQQAEAALAAEDSRSNPHDMWLAILALLYTGDIVTAHAECRRLTKDTRWSGSPQHWEVLTLLRARIRLLEGDGSEASSLLDVQLARGLSPHLSGLAVAWLIEAHVLSGELGQAHQVMHAHGLAGRLDTSSPDLVHILAARGALEHAAGQFQHSLKDFMACGRLLTDRKVANPAVIPWRSRASSAALATQQGDLALALAEEELVAARTWGSPRCIGLALHAVAVARRDGTSVALLEEAVVLLRLAYAWGELIQTLHDLGILQIDHKNLSAGRSHLETALLVARESGNRLWQHSLTSTLERLDVPHLTSQELHIGQLASAGYSNRQIAETLFLSTRTVEFHLSSVYRKLAISGRSELHSALHTQRLPSLRGDHCSSVV